MLWIHGSGIRPQFPWKGESQGVFRVAAGSVGSLELPRGPEGEMVAYLQQRHILYAGPLSLKIKVLLGLMK